MLPIKAFAGDINGPESMLLGIAGGVYEKDGYYWQLKGEYAEKGARYCARDDVDITEDEAAAAVADFYASVGDPTYFNNLGYVPGGPHDPNVTPTPEPTPEPKPTPEPETPDTVISDEVTKEEEPAEETSEEEAESAEDIPDVTANEIPEEPVSDGLTDTELTSGGVTDISGTEVEIIKIPDSLTSEDPGLTLSEMWEPARDYSNEEAIKEGPNFAIIAVVIVASLVVILGGILIVHKYNSTHRRNR